MALLEVEGLGIELAGVPVVQGVSFRLEAGRALAVVGESGSGKSLTALALLQLLPSPPARISSGSIRWGGEELVGASPARLRQLRGRELALVFQDPAAALSPVLTVGRQIEDARQAHPAPSRPGGRAAAVELLRRVGLPDPERRAGAYPHELSGGMKQRALLAAALACDPALLIADEPTAALDVTVQAQILALLASERRRRRMALLLVSHDLGAVSSACDDVAVMYAGRIVESGPVASVFAGPAHPYTAALLAVGRAITAARVVRGALPVIRGAVPPAGRFREAGCLFRERCDLADGRCAQVTPPFCESTARGVACHHPLPEAA
ncbi:MAG: ABC transporter ATP-binding protein [Myxococcales bacterium]